MRKKISLLAVLAAIMLLFNLVEGSARPALASPLTGQEAQTPQYAPGTQSAELFFDEARAVYLGNLERREAGQPPLRWNRELTLAARWFSWDSVENRPYGWIGHEDTQGKGPGDRTTRYGYLGNSGSENAAWASWSISAEDVINMWMNSKGHRENLLSPGHAEIGVGYYSRASDGSTYVTQDFGNDGVYPPLIIENEQLNTTSQKVSLYQYPGGISGGIGDLGKPLQMMISSSPCFTGASWQAYQPELEWTLPAGPGWKTVYSRLIDRQGRTSTASDTIYLGADLPIETLNLNQLSQTAPTVKLYNLRTNYPEIQTSLGWIEDDGKFEKLWGSQGIEADTAAIGRTTYKLDLDPEWAETSAWVYTYGFFTDQSMVAYFRLKTSSNTSGENIARIGVTTNGQPHERDIKGTDFRAANQYQEFAIPFTFDQAAQDRFLEFQFWRTGDAVIYVDAVTVFTASQPLTGSTYTWQVPDGHYRGQGVWVRYANGSTFTGYEQAATLPALTVTPTRLDFLVFPGSKMHQAARVSTCGAAQWSVTSAPAWLEYSQTGAVLDTWVNPAGLAPKTYTGSLVISTTSPPARATIPVQAVVADKGHQLYMPGVKK